MEIVIGSKHEETKRILEDRIAREDCDVVREAGLSCYFCKEEIEELAYKIVLQDKTGDETYHMHTRCR